MKCITGLFLSALIMLIAVDLKADIYTWTDEHGVKRYSDTAPDGASEAIKAQEEISSPPTQEKTDDFSDADLERAIQELEPDSRSKKAGAEKDAEPESEEPKIKAAKEAAVPLELEQRVQAEKERLQGEIDRIEQLAVGRSLSFALKQAMLKEYKDKLEALEKSPEEYFKTSQP